MPKELVGHLDRMDLMDLEVLLDQEDLLESKGLLDLQ